MAKPLYDLQPGDTLADLEADLPFLALYEPGIPQRLDDAGAPKGRRVFSWLCSTAIPGSSRRHYPDLGPTK